MMHLPYLITDLALILGAAAIVTLIFKKLKQPLVLGYIVAGLLVGPNFSLFPTITDVASIKIWAEIGVVILLFGLGLEFSFKKLVKVGSASSITAVFEVIFMLLIGYFTGKLLGWSRIDSIFLGGILSISSTTIIIRAFEELGVKNQKFAGLVFGVLIVEDLVAILLLVLLSTLAMSQQFAGAEMITSIIKLAFFLTLWFILGIFIIPTLLRKARKQMNDEIVLIISLGLCFLMVVLAVKVGFSPALGAFIMGSILAETIYAEKIEHLISSIKTLFGAIFFVSVGMLIDPAMLKQYAGSILLITVITISGKVFSTSAGALLAGQTLKQSVKAGLSLAQIGEFSFIIATLGLTLGVTSDFLYPIAVAVSAITTFTTPYFIKSAGTIYDFIERKMPAALLQNLNQYSSRMQSVKNESEWKKIYKSYTMLLATNSVILSGIILIAVLFLSPFIISKTGQPLVGNIITSVISLASMAPFLWAIVMKRVTGPANVNKWLSVNSNKGLLVILEFARVGLGIFFVVFLVYELFSTFIALLVALAIIIVTVFIFSKRLKSFYSLIEKRFISNLNERDIKTGRPVNEILPWDAHLAEFEIPAESPFAGKSLIELSLRERYGINIAKIERGKLKINLPTKEEKIFPGDTISVIGTDDQLDQFKRFIESSISEPMDNSRNQEVVLQQFIVTADFPMLGKTIRESGFREKTKGLIVGIERSGQRILNPDSNITFADGDVVWIVGEEGIEGNFRDKL